MGGYQCSLHFLKPSLAFVEKVNRGKNNYFLKLLSTSWVNQPEPIKRHFQVECFPAAIFGPNRPFESGSMFVVHLYGKLYPNLRKIFDDLLTQNVKSLTMSAVEKLCLKICEHKKCHYQTARSPIILEKVLAFVIRPVVYTHWGCFSLQKGILIRK